VEEHIAAARLQRLDIKEHRGRRNMLLHQMHRHVAPAEAGEEVLETAAEIGEAPDPEAHDAAGEPGRQRRPVGEDELYVALEHVARERAGLRRQGMVGGDNGHHGDRGEELGLEILRARRQRRVEREPRHTVSQPLLWPAQQLANQALRLPGVAERFTGSRDAGAHTGNAFPSTSWVADAPLPITPNSWRLTIGGAVAHPYTLTYADLLAHTDRLDAILDCTSGFYTLQTWQGARIGALLTAAHPHSDAIYVRVVSITGYRWSLPIAEANNALLATLVEGEPLIHDHGAPVRLVAPGRRGFQWVKWVTRIEALTTPDPGELLAIHTSSLTPAGRGER